MSEGQLPMAGSKKKFEIDKGKNKFKLEGITKPVILPGTNREVNIAFQKNAYDCGPCLVVNTLNVLNATSELDDILKVRRKNNEISGRTVGSEQWFEAYDIEQLLSAEGLDVATSFVQSPDDLKHIQKVINDFIRENKEFVIYNSAGMHYKSIYHQDENNIFLVDSLEPNEQVIRKDDQYINQFLQGTVNQGRSEVIGVVKRKEKSSE